MADEVQKGSIDAADIPALPRITLNFTPEENANYEHRFCRYATEVKKTLVRRNGEVVESVDDIGSLLRDGGDAAFVVEVQAVLGNHDLTTRFLIQRTSGYVVAFGWVHNGQWVWNSPNNNPYIVKGALVLGFGINYPQEVSVATMGFNSFVRLLGDLRSPDPPTQSAAFYGLCWFLMETCRFKTFYTTMRKGLKSRGEEALPKDKANALVHNWGVLSDCIRDYYPHKNNPSVGWGLGEKHSHDMGINSYAMARSELMLMRARKPFSMLRIFRIVGAVAFCGFFGVPANVI